MYFRPRYSQHYWTALWLASQFIPIHLEESGLIHLMADKCRHFTDHPRALSTLLLTQRGPIIKMVEHLSWYELKAQTRLLNDRLGTVLNELIPSHLQTREDDRMRVYFLSTREKALLHRHAA